MPALNLDTDSQLIRQRVADAATPLVACLCAEWCSGCREYRATFDLLADANPGLCFVWIDIETHADRMDDFDIDNFPTILIEDAQKTRFLGAVLPQPGILQRLVTQLDTLGENRLAPRLRARLAG